MSKDTTTSPKITIELKNTTLRNWDKRIINQWNEMRALNQMKQETGSKLKNGVYTSQNIKDDKSGTLKTDSNSKTDTLNRHQTIDKHVNGKIGEEHYRLMVWSWWTIIS